MRRLLLGTVIGAVMLVSGCGRDPGRDVKPMADPLGAQTPAAQPLEYIPIANTSTRSAAAMMRVPMTRVGGCH